MTDEVSIARGQPPRKSAHQVPIHRDRMDLILYVKEDGWVVMSSNEHGREVVSRLLPATPLDWGTMDDRRQPFGTAINLQRIVAINGAKPLLKISSTPKDVWRANDADIKLTYRLGWAATVAGARVTLRYRDSRGEPVNCPLVQDTQHYPGG